MNTQTLEYIIAIAEEKSISRAADRLLVSQPAISRQLKRVEERLGTKLFLRERGEMIRCRQNLCERGAIRPKYLRART